MTALSSSCVEESAAHGPASPPKDVAGTSSQRGREQQSPVDPAQTSPVAEYQQDTQLQEEDEEAEQVTASGDIKHNATGLGHSTEAG